MDTIKPYSPKVIVLENDNVVLTTDNLSYEGPAMPFLCGLLLEPELTDTFITGVNLYVCLARLNKVMQDTVPGWKMRISCRQKVTGIIRGRRYVRGSFFVDYISIDRKSTNGKRFKRRRVTVLNLDLIFSNPPKYPHEQLSIVERIIDLHHKRGITNIRLTKGSMGYAFLKASPLWQEGRHAAPRFINRHSRRFIPSNFYSLSSKARKSILAIDDCYLIDQISAHHNIVRSQLIPHPHYVRARGFYRRAMEKRDYYPVWTTPNQPTGECIINNHHSGLVLAKIHVSTLPPTKEHLYPMWARKRGSRYQWLWTPELRLFHSDHRLQLDSFVAGFTGTIDDPAIDEYGSWALDRINEDLRNRKYTKSILHSAYGMLALNTEKHKQVSRYWGGQVRGNKVDLPEAGAVSERVIEFPDRIQHPALNVIARGVIVAETHTRSLEYAKELDDLGHHVVQVRVDGLVVQCEQLPFIKQGWELKQTLSNVTFPHDTWLVADGIKIMPGIPISEEEQKTRERFARARAPLIHFNQPLTKLVTYDTV